MHRAFFLSCLFYLGISAATAQTGNSNIYLFKLIQESDTAISVVGGQYLTAFNPNGYNNHPSFFGIDELYISSRMPAERWPDLYRLSLSDSTITRITKTPEGEYSPRRMPDNYRFSAVRLEVNGADTLIRLWEFPIDRVTNGKPIFKYVNDLGYYTWINSQKVAAFRVGQPSKLTILDVISDREVSVAENVGRCFKALTNGNLAYVQKKAFGDWELMEYNPYNRTAVKVIETLTGSEDFETLPDGTFLMAKDSRIYKFNKRVDEDWVEIADLAVFELGRITRLAPSRDLKLAVVAN